MSVQLGVEEELGPAGGSLNVGAELSEQGGVSQIRVQDKTGKQTIISINTVSLDSPYPELTRLALAITEAAGTSLDAPVNGHALLHADPLVRQVCPQAAVEERVAALRLLGALASAVGTAAPTALASEWTAAVFESCSSEFSIVRRAAFEVGVKLQRI